MASRATHEGTAQRRKGASRGPHGKVVSEPGWDPGIAKPFPPHGPGIACVLVPWRDPWRRATQAAPASSPH